MPTVEIHEKLLIAFTTVKEGNMDERFSDRSVVVANRRKFLSQHGLNPRMVIEGKQIHGNRILMLDEENTKMWFGINIPGVDGFITDQQEVGLLTKVADCIPVVIYDPEHHVVGSFHAGWQGTVKNIHTKGLEMMTSSYQTDPEKVLVWLGPGAHKCCFTSTDTPDQINDPDWKSFIDEKQGAWHIDLPGFIKSTYQKSGVKKDNITVDPVCTVESDQFFSHSRSKQTGETEGRILVLVKLR